MTAIVLTIILIATLVAALTPSGLALGVRFFELVTQGPVQPESLAEGDWQLLSAMNGARLEPQALAGSSYGAVGVSSLQLITERDGRSFYVLERFDGRRCFAVGPSASTRRFGQAICSGTRFPSQQQPVLDLSVLHGQPGPVGVRVWRLEGFAADPITSVEVVATDGSVIVQTAVQDNVYSASDLPEEPAASIIGRSSSGEAVFTVCLARDGC
jgi:hypothetical protein